jgi:hypothetical protein
MRIGILASILCCSILTAAAAVPEFFARRDYPSAGGRVLLGDVNGDGIPDVVAVSYVSRISTLLGNGLGSFSAAVNMNLEFDPLSGGALADLNGDGKMDLVVSGENYYSKAGIGVLLSNGGGTFQQPLFYQAGSLSGALYNAVVGDFNGDGIPDVMAAGGGGMWLFTGQGGGTFNAGVQIPLALPDPFWIASADFNGAGNLDVAMSSYPSGLYVLFGNGTFQAPVQIGTDNRAYIVAAATTRDGYTDIVVPGANIYLNNGKGSFYGPVSVPVAGEGVAVGDVNGDGIPDLASSQGCVAYGLGGAKFTAQKCYTVANTGGWYNVALAELTTAKKGYNDIIAGLNGTVSVMAHSLMACGFRYRVVTTAVLLELSTAKARLISP